MRKLALFFCFAIICIFELQIKERADHFVCILDERLKMEIKLRILKKAHVFAPSLCNIRVFVSKCIVNLYTHVPFLVPWLIAKRFLLNSESLDFSQKSYQKFIG